MADTTVRLAHPGDESLLDAFLAQHADSSLSLRSVLAIHAFDSYPLPIGDHRSEQAPLVVTCGETLASAPFDAVTYSITSSARTRISGGMSTPKARAVFRLVAR